MFEWSRGSLLRAMMNAGVPGVEDDCWLEAWLSGFVTNRFELKAPLDILDVELGTGERPYRSHWKIQQASIAAIDAPQLQDRQIDARHSQRYDLVSLFSLERETCLRFLDLENPLPLLDMILN